MGSQVGTVEAGVKMNPPPLLQHFVANGKAYAVVGVEVGLSSLAGAERQ